MRIGVVDAEVGDIWESALELPDGRRVNLTRFLVIDIVEDRVGPIAWVHGVFSHKEAFERFERTKFDIYPRHYSLLARV